MYLFSDYVGNPHVMNLKHEVFNFPIFWVNIEGDQGSPPPPHTHTAESPTVVCGFAAELALL